MMNICFRLNIWNFSCPLVTKPPRTGGSAEPRKCTAVWENVHTQIFLYTHSVFVHTKIRSEHALVRAASGTSRGPAAWWRRDLESSSGHQVRREFDNIFEAPFSIVTPEPGLQFYTNLEVGLCHVLRTPSPEEHDLRLLRKSLFPGCFWAVPHAKTAFLSRSSEPFLIQNVSGFSILSTLRGTKFSTQGY
jgi:hypothetical protein